MNILKVLFGMSLIKGVSLPRSINKSKQTTRSILDIFFMISEIVVFLTNLIFNSIIFAFKLISKIVKYLYKKFCTEATVDDVKCNVINFEEIKNKRNVS